MICCLPLAALSCGKKAPDEVVTKDAYQTCPAAVYPTQHRVTVRTTDQIPGKLALKVDGVLKYDECLADPTIVPPAPAAYVTKKDGAFEVTVMHLDAYPTLPADISFEVIDRKNCVDPEVSFFSANQVPLEFKTEYPNGPKCGKNVHAKAEITKP